jgi:hypothetical protein
MQGVTWMPTAEPAEVLVTLVSILTSITMSPLPWTNSAAA